MAAINLTHADLDAVLVGTVVNEEVLQQVIDVSRLPLEFTDRLGTSSSGNKKYEWTMDRLQAVTDPLGTPNAFVDGQVFDQDDSVVGQRVSNEQQIFVKGVRVSTLSEASDSIGMVGRRSYQVNQRGQEVMRDIEAHFTSNVGANVDDGDTEPGITGSAEAWIDGKIIVPSAVGTTVFTQTAALQNLGGGITGSGWEDRDLVAPAGGVQANVYTVAVPTAMTETAINNVMEALFKNTGSRANRVLMQTVEGHSNTSSYYFTSSARIATLTSETTQAAQPATAKGAVNTILTDYGVLDMVPNPIMTFNDVAGSAPDSSTAYILDFSSLEMSVMRGFRVEALGKDGMSEKSMLSKVAGFKPLATESQGIILGVDTATAMVA